MSSIISVANLSKTYGSGFKALKNVNLDIKRGEIFALLGPNGAGKTTLISIICGIANPSEGKVLVGGENIQTSYRKARSLIGLVPQELHTDAFQQSAVTSILTTHSIEEAEEMADRIGVINKGEIVLVEDKATLMQKLGKKRLTLHLQGKLDTLPESLGHYELDLCNGGATLV